LNDDLTVNLTVDDLAALLALSDKAIGACAADVGAQPPIESTNPPTPDMPVSAADIRAAYRELYRATANAMDAAALLAQAHVVLKDAEAQIWPGSNETERKATMRAGTTIAREREQVAATYAGETERAQVLARIRVDELRTLLRLDVPRRS